MKKKILHVVGQMHIGGQEIMALNLFKYLNREEFSADYLVYTEKYQDLKPELDKLNANLLQIPSVNESGFHNYIKNIDIIMKKGKYDIVHVHTSFNAAIINLIAKKNKVPVIVTHSHTTNHGKKETAIYKIYSMLSRITINFTTTHRMACSKDAGSFLFGEKQFAKNGQIMPNGIYLPNYSGNINNTLSIRNKYNLNESKIYAHVGRFGPEKNHVFLLNVFFEIVKNDINAKLLLIGDGDLREEIIGKIQELGISENVILLGKRNDVPQLLAMVDIMIFPSIYEGMPVSLIEAQAAGVKCFVSTGVSRDIDITDTVEFLSLKNSYKEWAQKIQNYNVSKETKNKVIKINQKKLTEGGYNIEETCRILEKQYTN